MNRTRWSRLARFSVTLLVTLSASEPVSSATGQANRANCTYQGKRLYGKVQIVESLPDLKVKVVERLPDLRVKLVTSSPTRCGEWQIVDILPDLRVQFVETLPDIEIQLVESRPGVAIATPVRQD